MAKRKGSWVEIFTYPDGEKKEIRLNSQWGRDSFTVCLTKKEAKKLAQELLDIAEAL